MAKIIKKGETWFYKGNEYMWDTLGNLWTRRKKVDGKYMAWRKL